MPEFYIQIHFWRDNSDKMTLEQTANGVINIDKHSPSTPSNIVILGIHGFCCDSRIFKYLGTQISKNGIHFYSIDIPGHGESYGEKGNTDFEKSLESINEIVQNLKKSYKVYILAHSMGCTYALWYSIAFKKSINGLILLAPYVRIPSVKKRSEIEPDPLKFLYLSLRRIITPNSKIMAVNDLPNFKKIGGQEIASMLKDNKLNFHYSYKYIIDILAMRNSRVKQLSSIDLPILLIHGKKDKNVYPQVSEAFYKLVKSKDKKLETLDCDHWFYHAVFYNQDTMYSEQDRMKLVTLITDWIKSH